MSMIDDYNKGVDASFRGEPIDYTKSMAHIQAHKEGARRRPKYSVSTQSGGGFMVLLMLFALYMLYQSNNPAPQAPREPIDAHLQGMPSPEQVRTAFPESNDADSDARQYAAYWTLVRGIDNLSAGRVFRNELTPREQRLKTAYVGAMREIERRHPNDPEFRKRYLALWLQKDAQIDTFSRLTSTAWRSKYLPQAIP